MTAKHSNRVPTASISPMQHLLYTSHLMPAKIVSTLRNYEAGGAREYQDNEVLDIQASK